MLSICHRDEIKLFLEVQGKRDLVAYLNEDAQKKRVAYLADVLDQLNKLNLKLQGQETHMIQFQKKSSGICVPAAKLMAE
ncbi:hypothetical protein JRQ81_001697, partial [Phrynocephalus forsythii]